jgi:hypothetical protein
VDGPRPGDVNGCTFPGDFKPSTTAREVTTAAGAVRVKQPRRLKRRGPQLGHETESNLDQNELRRTARVLTGNVRLVLGRNCRHLVTVNLFALAAVAVTLRGYAPTWTESMSVERPRLTRRRRT